MNLTNVHYIFFYYVRKAVAMATSGFRSYFVFFFKGERLIIEASFKFASNFLLVEFVSTCFAFCQKDLFLVYPRP